MKRYVPLLLMWCLLLSVTVSKGAPTGRPVHVSYTFDHYAQNGKVARSYISEAMIDAAVKSGKLNHSTWGLQGVASRLTSLLLMHTHSRSTTKSFKEDYKNVARSSDYECLLSEDSGDIRLVVFAHRSKGRTIGELLIFRFRSDYCTRVVQLTGKLRESDIPEILKMTKSKKTSSRHDLDRLDRYPEYYLQPQAGQALVNY